MNKYLRIFGSFSSLMFSDKVARWFCKDSSNFLNVSRYYCCQRNEYTMFLILILCSVESNFVINLPNEPLCSLVQDNFRSQIALKNLIFKL